MLEFNLVALSSSEGSWCPSGSVVECFTSHREVAHGKVT